MGMKKLSFQICLMDLYDTVLRASLDSLVVVLSKYSNNPNCPDAQENIGTVFW